ncbi:MAG TPA: AraC family transcriptional regulator [Gemmatimonadaceae bacterium]|jgi:AraC-like DNA-binding protein|nr:AraC family transcriptional regulator [Gemmatimonadaceae bacterium]
MGVIATLLPNSTRLQRLRAAIRDRHSIVACDDWSHLTRMCDSEPIHLAVIDLYADGTANFESVRLLKLRFPRVALVAYVGVTPERARDMFDAGRCGFDGLIVADIDDAPMTLLAHVDKAEARSVASLLRRAIGDLKPTARDAVLASVTRAHERLTPDAFARMLAVPRRLLTRRLTDAGFPPPHRLLTWGRLIVAAHMLEDKHRSADSVAQVLDFPSGSAFRNTCQRYLQATPQQLRERGGAAYVIETFMGHARRAAAAPRRPRVPRAVVETGVQAVPAPPDQPFAPNAFALNRTPDGVG